MICWQNCVTIYNEKDLTLWKCVKGLYALNKKFLVRSKKKKNIEATHPRRCVTWFHYLMTHLHTRHCLQGLSSESLVRRDKEPRNTRPLHLASSRRPGGFQGPGPLTSAYSRLWAPLGGLINCKKYLWFCNWKAQGWEFLSLEKGVSLQ